MRCTSPAIIPDLLGKINGSHKELSAKAALSSHQIITCFLVHRVVSQNPKSWSPAQNTKYTPPEIQYLLPASYRQRQVGVGYEAIDIHECNNIALWTILSLNKNLSNKLEPHYQHNNGQKFGASWLQLRNTHMEHNTGIFPAVSSLKYIMLLTEYISSIVGSSGLLIRNLFEKSNWGYSSVGRCV